MSDTFNPFVVKLEEAYITKFDRSDKLNIMPQIFEFVLHQSIFSPVLKATVVFSDSIGLMNNYPLSGEERIEVVLTQIENVKKELSFCITAIRDIVSSETTRTTSYVMELASEEAFANAKLRVSKAYQPQPANNIISDIYNNYIVKSMTATNSSYRVKPLLLNVETEDVTSNNITLVVPNIKPFDAINWVCQYAVVPDQRISYTPIFFETIDRFVFKGLQQITYKSTLGNLTAKSELEKEKYFYISNIELIRNNTTLYNNLVTNGFDETRSISDVVINKRYSGLEKIIGGYFENELVEINPIQRNRNITYTSIDAQGRTYRSYVGPGGATIDGTFNTTAPNRGSVYHTNGYIENIKNEDTASESSARIHYMLNFFESTKLRDKFGNSSRSFIAFQQVDLSIAVPSNLAHVPGDFIYVVFPEFHGFNENREDRYLSGIFLISEVKTVMSVGGKSVTYLKINRDTFNESIDRPSEYQL